MDNIDDSVIRAKRLRECIERVLKIVFFVLAQGLGARYKACPQINCVHKDRVPLLRKWKAKAIPKATHMKFEATLTAVRGKYIQPGKSDDEDVG